MHALIHHSHDDGSPYPLEECAIYQAFRTGDKVHVEGEVLWRRDGSSFHSEYWSHPVKHKGKVTGAVVTFLDITERMQAAEALRQADRRKDEFLATLAHELRNPLAPIRTGLEVLGHVGDNPEKVGEIRVRLERQVSQLVRLIDDLMDVSRITHGRLQLQTSPVDLRDVVASAIDAVRPYIEAREQDLLEDTGDGELYINGDEQRLTQVVSNLLVNASKYSDGGTAIRLRAGRDGEMAFLEVEDEGRGLTEQDCQDIFEMFRQVGEINPTDAGLGIGLTLVKSLVEAHGGTVDVRSPGPGQGSTFRVELPAVEASLAEAEQAADEVRGDKLRVLVVDDNIAAQDMLRMGLELLGFEIETAENGQVALDLGGEFRPQVVLMDLAMPVMDGLSAARKMRETDWGKEAQLIALSGFGQDDDKERSREAGFDDHLTKPVQMRELMRRISSLA